MQRNTTAGQQPLEIELWHLSEVRSLPQGKPLLPEQGKRDFRLELRLRHVNRLEKFI